MHDGWEKGGGIIVQVGNRREGCFFQKRKKVSAENLGCLLPCSTYECQGLFTFRSICY